ncbi:MAG: hypothetical protein ACRDRP_05115 [Pseudonocardiaceae bacterium]
MTAAAVKPPFADASPAEIRAELLPEEQPDFDRPTQPPGPAHPYNGDASWLYAEEHLASRDGWEINL